MTINWITSNWHEMWSPYLAHAFLTLIAVGCGCIVGAEREEKDKPAGIRTMTLVALGAAVFTMVSLKFSVGDPGRIAAQIVSGIGFLGAGAILRGPGGVRGMTTAATIWAMAAVGMVVGAGYALPAVGLSLLILVVLRGIKILELHWARQFGFGSLTLVYEACGGKTLIRIENVLQDQHVEYHPHTVESAGDGLEQLRIPQCRTHGHHTEFLIQLAEMPEVREIRREGREGKVKHGGRDE